MPRHVRTTGRTALRPELQEICDALVHELHEESGAVQPIIIEDVSEETHTTRVTVIWDRWQECADEQRAAVIEEAYRVAFGDDFVKRITVPLGVTVNEAFHIGLVPFYVRPARRPDDAATETDYHNAMLAEGASPAPLGTFPQFWLATIEDAEALVERLEARLPGSRWVIVEQRQTNDFEHVPLR